MCMDTRPLVYEDLTELVAATKIKNLWLWLSFMRETLSTKDFQKLLVVCWAIWGARRKALHEDVFQNPLSTYGFVSKFLNDMELTRFGEGNEAASPIKSKQSIPKWIAPPDEIFKIQQ